MSRRLPGRSFGLSRGSSRRLVSRNRLDAWLNVIPNTPMRHGQTFEVSARRGGSVTMWLRQWARGERDGEQVPLFDGDPDPRYVRIPGGLAAAFRMMRPSELARTRRTLPAPLIVRVLPERTLDTHRDEILDAIMRADDDGSATTRTLHSRRAAGPAISLLSIWALVVPLIPAVAAGVLAGHFSPNVSSEPALASLNNQFGTAGQIIAALRTLAVEARYAEVWAWTAGLTLGYVSVALVAAVVGTSPALSHSVYPVLVGVTAGGGLGALVGTVLVGFQALRSAAAEAKAIRLEKIANPRR